MRELVKIIINKILENGTEEDIKLLFTRVRQINYNYRKMKDKTILKRIIDNDEYIYDHIGPIELKSYILKHIDLCVKAYSSRVTRIEPIMVKVLNEGTEEQIDSIYEVFYRYQPHEYSISNNIQLLVKMAHQKPIRAAYLLIANGRHYKGILTEKDKDELYEIVLQDLEAIITYFKSEREFRCPKAEEILKNAPGKYKLQYLKYVVFHQIENENSQYIAPAVAFFDEMIADSAKHPQTDGDKHE